MEPRYVIEEYVTETGEIPFLDWVNSLKDRTAQRKIAIRLRRTSFGNFGDCKPIKGAKDLWEMREHDGSGYRIFYRISENTKEPTPCREKPVDLLTLATLTS